MAILTTASGDLPPSDPLVDELGNTLVDDVPGGTDISEILTAIDTLNATGGTGPPLQPLLPQACL